MAVLSKPPYALDPGTGALIEADVFALVPSGLPSPPRLPIVKNNLGQEIVANGITLVDLNGEPVSQYGGRFGYDYSANGVDDTAGVRAVIAAAIAGGEPASIVVRGPTCALWITPGNELDVTGMPANSSLTFEGTVLRRWNPLAPDTTIGGWIKGTGTDTSRLAPDFKLRFGAIDYFPKITWEGYVAAVTATTFDVDMKPGWAPAFDTMRVMHAVIDNVWEYSQSEERGASAGVSYPITLVSGNRYRVTPNAVSITITGIASLNPLTVISAVPLNSERELTGSAFSGLLIGGVSVVNGKTFTINLEDDNPTQAVLLLNGEEVNATGATAMTGTGLLTAVSVSSWVVPGLEMIGVCRKRGTPELEVRYPKGWNVGGRIKYSTAVFLDYTFGEDLTIDELEFRGDGRLSGTAGGVILTEHRGFVKFNSISADGVGDDTFNITSRYWNKFLIANGVNSLTVNATKVTMPRIGDMMLFRLGTMRIKAAITAISGPATATQVTVATPAGYAPATWTIRNLSVVPVIRGGKATTRGGSRSYFPQASDWSFDNVDVSYTRGAVIRAQDPKSGAHSSSGSFAGGGGPKSVKAFTTAMQYVSSASSGVLVYRIQGATEPSGLPPVVHGPTSLDTYGFSAIIVEGVGAKFSTLYLANDGVRRAVTPQLVADPSLAGNFALVATAATIEIGELNRDALFWVRSKLTYGGRVIIGNSGCMMLTQTVDANATINTIAYGTHRITVNLTTARTYIVSQGVAQSGDTFTASYVGTGGSAIYRDEATNNILATLSAGQRATFVNTGTGWVP